MDSVSSHNEDVDSGYQRPDPSPVDKLVSSYLKDRSDVYRDLVKVQDDVSISNFLHEPFLLVDLLSRYGTIPKLPRTSVGNVARPTTRDPNHGDILTV